MYLRKHFRNATPQGRVITSSFYKKPLRIQDRLGVRLMNFIARGPKKKVTLIIKTYIEHINTCNSDVMQESSLPGAIVIEGHLFNIDEQAGWILHSTKSILMSMSTLPDHSVRVFFEVKVLFLPAFNQFCISQKTEGLRLQS